MVNKRPIKWLKNKENLHASLWEYCRGLEHQSHNMLEVNGKKTKNKTKDKRQEHNTIILQMKRDNKARSQQNDFQRAAGITVYD